MLNSHASHAWGNEGTSWQFKPTIVCAPGDDRYEGVVCASCMMKLLTRIIDVVYGARWRNMAAKPSVCMGGMLFRLSM